MNTFIRSWEVVSPLGVGRAAFTQRVRALSGSPRKADGVLATTAFTPETFDKRTHLGKKGVRGMDTLAGYAVVASELLMRGLPGETRQGGSKVGVVLGTGSGSLSSHLDFILDLHRQESVEWVNPLQFPQTVMNCAAGQISIWHHFTGINVTVSSGYHSGLSALEFANNALKGARAERILCGCVEELSRYTRFVLPSDRRRLRQEQVLGEGAMLALLEPRRTQPNDVEVLASARLAGMARWDMADRVSRILERVATAVRSRPSRSDGFDLLCYNRFSSQEDELAYELARRLPATELVCSNHYLGDCVAATGGLQIALLLAWTAARPGARLLAITFDPEGVAAFCVLEAGETA